MTNWLNFRAKVNLFELERAENKALNNCVEHIVNKYSFFSILSNLRRCGIDTIDAPWTLLSDEPLKDFLKESFKKDLNKTKKFFSIIDFLELKKLEHNEKYNQ